MKGTEQTRKFLQDNLSAKPYDLLRLYISEVYPKIEIDFDKVPNSLFDKAENDILLFKSAEQSRHNINYICVGDYIRSKSGQLTKVWTFLCDGKFQDTEGGSFNISKSGTGSYSGGFTGNVLNQSDYIFSGEYLPLNCWIFSGFSAGGNRGVHNAIMVKVWNER